MINAINQLMNGNTSAFTLSEIAKLYNNMSATDKTAFGDMLNQFLPPILSKTFRITMNESEAFRDWLAKQIKNNMKLDEKIEEKY